ncbi:hypothetical protein DPX16_18663 [Anabarilius grahami]|uniref:Uncharacterized protein n=1 Tax=Anabarilius grahami TaxID=495550 RepID=A0A3N0YPG3_ANAGA|nr:hypothetical protein DPX16_18663 [Anabarilius grahami]
MIMTSTHASFRSAHRHLAQITPISPTHEASSPSIPEGAILQIFFKSSFHMPRDGERQGEKEEEDGVSRSNLQPCQSESQCLLPTHSCPSYRHYICSEECLASAVLIMCQDGPAASAD